MLGFVLLGAMVTNPLYSAPSENKRPSGSNGTRGDEGGWNCYRKDYARLLHAPSFRRLQGKTQLFPGSESDFFRNRLTHSLEVAQIARGIASTLNASHVQECFPGAAISEDLVEFAAIAHDLGHPPFGHNGEYALDGLMRQHGGFEGNAQTLRILAAVEKKLLRGDDSKARFGLDLTYRSLASVLKYDSPIPLRRKKLSKVHKGYYATEANLVGKIKESVAPGLPKGVAFKTIECAIMDIADDIAYSTYDLEDSLHAGFISPMRLAAALVNNADVQQAVLQKTNTALQKAGHKKVSQLGELLKVIVEVFNVHMPQPIVAMFESGRKAKGSIAYDGEFALIANVEAWKLNQKLQTDSLARTRFTAERVGKLISAVQFVPCKEYPQLSSVCLSRPQLLQVEVMKHLNYELVIRSPQLAVVENRGKDLICNIFNALNESKGVLLPSDWRVMHQAEMTERGKMRVVCDYIACMTDRYAAEFHARLFGEGISMFKPL